MVKTFDADAFIRRIGERLVREFEDARAATTPSSAGTAAEQPVRKQLEQVLPRGIGVGEGFVIDTYGGTSRQQDVILFEREICPVFSINDTPATTYYPCEGVLAVGEIKSTLDGEGLKDAFCKIESAKALRRYEVPHGMPHPETGAPLILTRGYLTQRSDANVLPHVPATPIFGFVLAGRSRLSRETLVSRFSMLSAEKEEHLVPNLAMTLDGYAVRWGKIAKQTRDEIRKDERGNYGLTVHHDGPEVWQESWSAEGATHAAGSEDTEVFRMLIRWLWRCADQGRTSDVRSFDRYFEQPTHTPSPLYGFPKLRRMADGSLRIADASTERALGARVRNSTHDQSEG